MERGLDYTGILVNTICYDGAGKFLFIKTQNPQGVPKWGFGVITLQFGEEPEEACVRQLKKDYGCMGTIEHLLGITTLHRKHAERNSHWLVLTYLVHVNPTDCHLPTPDDPHLSWHFLSDPPKLLHDGTITILKHFKPQLPQK